MDGNKDEALKCLKIGQAALGSGDRARALKFITKARRLDPALSVDDLLSNIEDQSGGDSTNGSSAKPMDSDNDNANSGPRRRVPPTGLSSSTTSVAYTEEHASIVRDVKRKKDYYDILGLEKSCSVEDIRKAYRKLSLKVHPDKNKAPGAEEAFKLVSKSFKCLSDEESRKRYDLVGSDEVVYERRATRQHEGFNGFYDGGDVDAEEIFRNFFFGGMHPTTTTQFSGFSFGNGVRVRMGHNHEVAASSNLRVLIQLLPVILILLLNFLPSSQPIYSLSKEYPYEHRITTQKGVNYYVKSTKFEQDYPYGSNERGALQLRIEREYFSILRQNCEIETQRLRWGFIKEAPHCDALKRFQTVA